MLNHGVVCLESHPLLAGVHPGRGHDRESHVAGTQCSWRSEGAEAVYPPQKEEPTSSLSYPVNPTAP
jgi:hypothetical protein